MFSSGVKVNSALRGSGNEGAHGVDDGECRDVVLLCHDDGAMGVLCFARLGDDEEAGVLRGDVMWGDFGGVDDLDGVECFQRSHC